MSNYNFLNQINFPSDLKKISESNLQKVADELREETISAVSETGGHLGASLGVVELTVALHYVFNTPKDKNTGKEQNITIKASSGLSDEEVEKMVKDAEAHAEEDKKFQELVSTKNMADGLVYSTKQSLEELKDEISEDEKKQIEEAVSELEEVIKGDDKEAIDAKVQNLSEKAQVLAQKAQEKAGNDNAGDSASSDKTEYAS